MFDSCAVYRDSGKSADFLRGGLLVYSTGIFKIRQFPPIGQHMKTPAKKTNANAKKSIGENNAQAWAAQGVRMVLAQFADMNGTAKGKLVPIEQWDSFVAIGAGFAGPSIIGTGLPRSGPRSEYYGRPDLTTARILPWQSDTLHVVCNGYVDGQPFDGCPRQILLQQTQRLAALGLQLQVGIEPEFFLFAEANDGQTKSLEGLVSDQADRLDKPSYDLKSLLKSPIRDCLYAMAQHLRAFGFKLEQIDHEDAPAQYEVNYQFDHALAAADQFMRFKLAAHAIAQQHGFDFCLMPKPFADRPGSGLHFHLSLTDKTDISRNRMMPSRHDEGLLSPLGLQALAGLLAHAPALACVHAPTVNSYKRLISSGSASGTTWAPTHIAHGPNNRSAVARTLKGRIEWRIPDGCTNIYLALAAVIAAMIDGVESQLVAPPQVTEDISTWSIEKLRTAKITQLPENLGAAITAFSTDKVITQALGSEWSQRWITHKNNEWSTFNRTVHAWEFSQYQHLA